MSNLPNNYVYRQDVIDFVTVAVETCLLFEHVAELEKHDFVEKALAYLPLLYVRTRALPQPEEQIDGFLQTFVSEDDYNFVREGVSQLLGPDDVFLEVFVEDMRYSDEPVSAFVSENMADIYQELKDMAANFQLQDEEVMTAAVANCLESFHMHWGQKLLNTLRPLHAMAETNAE